MKKIFFILFTLIILPLNTNAAEYNNEAEIDLDSIRYNKTDNTSEIRIKLYNENYLPNQNEIYYAIYYLKMDCGQRLYKPMIIEGYNKKDELMLVDYEPRQKQQIMSGSNIEQAYNYACQIKSIPNVKEDRRFNKK
ncbi:hypothetical protein IJG14_03380 [bacterium]|nr:hypothetical protein [bacterium]